MTRHDTGKPGSPVTAQSRVGERRNEVKVRRLKLNIQDEPTTAFSSGMEHGPSLHPSTMTRRSNSRAQSQFLMSRLGSAASTRDRCPPRAPRIG